MSSNIQVQRVCQLCGKEFTARTTVTQYCSDTCAKKAYKARIQAIKVHASSSEMEGLKTMPFQQLKAKEFLTVRDVATLLNISVRSVYNHIESGNLKAVNLGQRITRIKRSDLDKLFDQPRPVTAQPENTSEPVGHDISDCYNLSEVQSKYGISEAALQQLIKRNRIPKLKKGWYAYVPKTAIDQLFS